MVLPIFDLIIIQKLIEQLEVVFRFEEFVRKKHANNNYQNLLDLGLASKEEEGRKIHSSSSTAA